MIEKTIRAVNFDLAGLSFCSAGPRTSELKSYGSCESIGLTPGSNAYEQCEENLLIHEEVLARKAFNGNKNQPDGVMAQTYAKRISVSINCTSYSYHVEGSPTLCN